MRFRATATLLLTAAKEWLADRCDGLAGALAFFGGLSIAPFLAVVLWLSATLLGKELAESRLIPVMAAWLGPRRVDAVKVLFEHSQGIGPQMVPSLSTLAVISLLLGTMGFFLMAQDSLETIWNVRRETLGIVVQLKKRLLSLLIALASGLIVLAGFMIAATIYQPVNLAHRSTIGWLYQGLLLIVVFAVYCTLNLLWLWAFIPVRLSWRRVLPWAALIATAMLLGWRILLWRMLGQEVSDAAQDVITSIMWLYYTASIFLYGAELMRCHIAPPLKPDG